MVGFAASLQTLTFAVAKDIIAPQMFATASGFINMVAVLGGALSQVLFGFVLHKVGHIDYFAGVEQYDIFGYQVSMLLLPASSFVGFMITRLFLVETRCHQASLIS